MSVDHCLSFDSTGEEFCVNPKIVYNICIEKHVWV